jgi:hypothetical protein
VDLEQTVADRLSIDAERAIKGLGTLFVAMRMAADMKTFSQIASAFPESGRWMLEAPFESAGTGEMLALATPGAVRRMLAIAGFEKAQIPELCKIVGSAVRAAVPPATYQAVVGNLPLFE